MIVISLSRCPNALRGELTRWFFEVDTNLYVGKHSARIRDKIWERITAYIKTGQAIMVYPTNNEQGFDFRVWGSVWQPIDYDGLKLMLRPHPGGMLVETNALEKGNTKVERRFAAKRYAKGRRNVPALPNTYLVIDIETTGLSADTDVIIEIGAVKVIDRESSDIFQSLVKIEAEVPPAVVELTGITNQIMSIEGRDHNEVIREFKSFANELPIVSHNVSFDMAFLRKAYEKCGLSMPTNSCIDTLRLSKLLIDDSADYKLATLLERMEIEYGSLHRVIEDCRATQQLFEKLREISSGYVDDKVNENGDTE